MKEITLILNEMNGGNPRAAAELLPLVYEELRRLAAQRMARENPGHTLQATALVHEAYLRLVGSAEHTAEALPWNGRAHFFGAAAEAMRRILVECARRKQARKRGAGAERVDLDDVELALPETEDRVVEVSEALDRLEADDPAVADLVKLRFFAGLTGPEAAAALGLTDRTASRRWAYARAWLFRELHDGGSTSPNGVLPIPPAPPVT